jgi:DNA polymerase-4
LRAASSRICCLDLDTFFVSVERVLDPSLVGKPVIVGGQPGQRGVVVAASYEVRPLGVHSGISLTEAGRLAPHAVFVPPRHGVYGEYSTRVREVVERFAPVIRVASIDEMFLDLRGCERMVRRPGDADDDAAILRYVRSLCAAVLADTGLPASVGIGTSRAVCKIASALAKPAGVLLVPAGGEAVFLAPLPARRYPGIGPVAESRLAAVGIHTLGDLAAAAPAVLARALGSAADAFRRGAVGDAPADLGDDRPAFREHDPAGHAVGSISNERTFHEDVGSESTLHGMICALVERVCWRARRRGVIAGSVSLRLRYADFETLTRSRSLPATASDREVLAAVLDLYQRARTRSLRVRLLGVALSELRPEGRQLSLLDHDEPLRRTVDAIRERYGFDALRLAAANRRAFRHDDTQGRA